LRGFDPSKDSCLGRFIWRENDPVETQKLSDGPGLERTAARQVRRIPFRDLGNVAGVVRIEKGEERPVVRLDGSGVRWELADRSSTSPWE